MKKSELSKYIESKKDEFIALSDAIWDYAELSLKEEKSAEYYMSLCEREGFSLERGISGIKTAFKATYGFGAPVIGILAEYDALSGLSQKPCVTEKIPEDNMNSGHGCGHNLLGAGSFAAAVAVKKYIQENKKGTVVFYGCPGEEGGAAKAFMARDNEFRSLDAALTWHPSDTFEVTSGSNISSIQIEYTFEGIAAHAASDPHMGRSALDAVELMNIGVQFLREHMSSCSRIHYAITDAGGISPNVVQEKAKVLYMIRGGRVADSLKLVDRVDNIAKGATLITDTKLSRRFIDGTADVVTNSVLERVLYKNYESISLPEYTKEEKSFAEKLKATYAPCAPLVSFASELDEKYRDYISDKTDNGKAALADFLIPYYHTEAMQMGSTDVGDVSYLTPTAQIQALTFTAGAPGHSWQNVTMGKTSIAHKGMLTAAKVIASAAVDLIEDWQLLNDAKKEFDKKTSEGYACPIEKGAVPQVI